MNTPYVAQAEPYGYCTPNIVCPPAWQCIGQIRNGEIPNGRCLPE